MHVLFVQFLVGARFSGALAVGALRRFFLLVQVFSGAFIVGALHSF
jgi:hypothetical protein